MHEAPIPEAYFADTQVPHRQMHMVVRTAGDPIDQIGALRADIKALDPNLPVPSFRTLDQVVADSIARPRLLTTLLGLFASVALTLAAVGIFGLLSFAVAQRTREIGIRIALGASPGILVSAIARSTSVLIAVGLSLGLGGALALSRVLEGELFGVNRLDPLALLGVIVVLGITALVASVGPAWRASRMDPPAALRGD